MSKIGEIHVTMRGMREVQRSAMAMAACMEGCRLAFEKLVSDIGEVLEDAEIEASNGPVEDAELE